MPFGIVQFGTASSGTGTTNLTPTFGSNVTAGNSLLLLARTGASFVVSSFQFETWTAGNLYGGGGLKQQAWWVGSAVGGWTGNQVTFNGSAGFPVIGMWEISQANTTAPLDVQTFGEVFGVAPISTPAYSSQFVNEIFFAQGSDNATWSVGPTPTISGGGPWTLDTNAPPGGGTINNSGIWHWQVSSGQTGVVTTFNYSGGSGTTATITDLLVVSVKGAVNTPVGGGIGWTNRQRKFINLR